MSDFSLKGVLRKHKGRTPDVDVRTDVIDPSGLFPAYNWSLRDLLDSWSSTEHSWQMRECFKEIGSKYDWQAKYEQAWTTIRVRIKLKPKNDGVEQIIDDDN
ncbi:MAG: hypothetical protein GTN89_13135, partial [Acidobacteria bacterium]|nr:hypothetical protein [Acidobacteriota bacterium]